MTAETAANGKRVDVAVVGGFLGAGKTTALLRIAALLAAQGRKVGLITNDQADGLVDTGRVRSQGLRVEEVAGACFCCKFDDLAAAAERIRQDSVPDVLLCEPVGSCTDLAATVVRPLQRFYGDRYRTLPYSVLVDPLRARQMVLQRGFGGFSSKVAYLFGKQLEEADVLCLNKTDALETAQRDELLAALAAEFPRARVLPVSARTGAGFEGWLSALWREDAARPGGNAAEVDYDLYAEGEAELGWLNWTLELEAAQAFEPDRVVRELVAKLGTDARHRGAEVAHLKALLRTAGGAAAASDTGSGAEVTQPCAEPAHGGVLVLNARVHLDPEVLRGLAEAALAAVLGSHGIDHRTAAEAWFRPARPVPTHRFTDD